MKKHLLGISLFFLSNQLFASICPDPNLSSLRQGTVPLPWEVSPYTEHSPQGENGAQFVRANILVVGGIGRGVGCTYQNSVGFYSIWRQGNVKVPARTDYNWHDTLGGFVCAESIEACQFYINPPRAL